MAGKQVEKVIVDKFVAAQDSLVLQSADLSLETIANMVKGKSIDVSPDYQRRERWTPEAKAALIESFLLNVPIPPVYLAEDDFGTYSVIDGKQRISAIAEYLGDKFSLKKLQRFQELDGFKFSELPLPLRNALSIRPYIRAVTLLKQSDTDLKYEVFTRLNTGGQPLLPQEIRNALYRGNFNQLLFTLSENPYLRKQLKIVTLKESAYTEMLDVELPLRFFAIKNSWENFSGDYRRSMDAFMAKHQKLSKAKLASMELEFSRSIDLCKEIWADNAFRRFEKGIFRDQFLSAMFDAQMVATSILSSSQVSKVKQHKAKILNETKALFNDKRFEEAVRVSTNTPTRVAYRIRKILDLLTSV